MIEKLIGRLEEQKTNAEEGKEVIIHHEGHSLDYEFLNGRQNAFEETIEIVNQLAEEEKCRETNVITSFLQYVRDNSDNPEYDTENGWSLADLIDLSIKFSNAKERCDAVYDLEKDGNERW